MPTTQPDAGPQYLTTGDIGRATGIDDNTIRVKCVEGTIKAMRVGHVWAVPIEEARRWFPDVQF